MIDTTLLQAHIAKQTGIPAELLSLRRWFLVKHNKTPTISGWQDTDNLSTYYELDGAAITAGYLPAFVFLAQDGYLFVDFDKTATLPEGEVKNFHLNCLHNTTTYAETSVSGNGFHLIYKHPEGWDAGRKNKTTSLNMECYSHDRYGILTGNRINNNNIIECPLEVNLLSSAASRRRDAGTQAYPLEGGEAVTDSYVVEQMYANDNDNLLKDFDTAYRNKTLGDDFDTSAFDLAFCTRAGLRTESAEQIERLWLSHPVSRRDWKPANHPNRHKTLQRSQYRKETIRKALSSPSSKVNMRAFTDSLPVFPKPREPATPKKALTSTPRGIMAILRDYYTATALHTFPEAEMHFLIAFMSRYVNGTYTLPAAWRFGSTVDALGTFSLLIAGTGRGKSFPMSIMNKIDNMLYELDVPLSENTKRAKLEIEDQHVPYTFKKLKDKLSMAGKPPSGAGLRKLIVNKRGRVHLDIGEFEPFWDVIKDSRHTQSTEILAGLLMGYDGSSQRKVTYSKEENDLDEVQDVFLGLSAEATHTLYSKISEENIKNGLMNRFLIWDYSGPMTQPNYSSASEALTTALKEALLPLITTVAEVTLAGGRLAVGITVEASTYFKQRYGESIMAFNKAHEDGDYNAEITAAIAARDFKKAQRLAVYSAVSRNPTAPEVIKWDVEWALGVASETSKLLIKKALSNQLYTPNIDYEREVADCLSTFFRNKKGGELAAQYRAHNIVTMGFIRSNGGNRVSFTRNPYKTPTELIKKGLKGLEEMDIVAAADKGTVCPSLMRTIKVPYYYVNRSALEAYLEGKPY